MSITKQPIGLRCNALGKFRAPLLQSRRIPPPGEQFANQRGSPRAPHEQWVIRRTCSRIWVKLRSSVYRL
jgi:hypothetical protein